MDCYLALLIQIVEALAPFFLFWFSGNIDIDKASHLLVMSVVVVEFSDHMVIMVVN